MVFAERENDTGLYVDLVIIGFGTRVYLFCRKGISVPEVQSENSSAPDSGRCEPGLQICNSGAPSRWDSNRPDSKACPRNRDRLPNQLYKASLIFDRV